MEFTPSQQDLIILICTKEIENIESNVFMELTEENKTKIKELKNIIKKIRFN